MIKQTAATIILIIILTVSGCSRPLEAHSQQAPNSVSDIAVGHASLPSPGEQNKNETDEMFEATGVHREDALTFFDSVLYAINNDDPEALAGMIAYPRKITTPNSETTLSSPEDFLPYYSAIFTNSFKKTIQQDYSSGLFWHDGMISMGSGSIWIAPLDGDLSILTIQSNDGYSIR